MLVADRLPVDLGVQQRLTRSSPNGSPLARCCAALRDLLLEVVAHPVEATHRLRVVGDALFERVLDPAPELVAVLFGDAEQVGDHASGDVLRVLFGRVAAVLLRELVDQIGADLPRAGLERPDAFGANAASRMRRAGPCSGGSR